MSNDKTIPGNVTIPLSWLVSPGSGNGAAGRPFPTAPSAPPPDKPRELPHASAKPAALPREETPVAGGLKGGEEEC